MNHKDSLPETQAPWPKKSTAPPRSSPTPRACGRCSFDPLRRPLPIARSALAERDLTQVGWNADPREWRGNSEDAIVAYVHQLLARATAPGFCSCMTRTWPPACLAAHPRLDRAGKSARGPRRGVPIRIVDYSVLLPDQALRAKEVDTAVHSRGRFMGQTYDRDHPDRRRREEHPPNRAHGA